MKIFQPYCPAGEDVLERRPRHSSVFSYNLVTNEIELVKTRVVIPVLIKYEFNRQYRQRTNRDRYRSERKT